MISLSSSNITTLSHVFFRFCRSGIKRIGTEDPRMAKVVVHGGIAYLSGLTDSSVEDGKRN